MILANISFILPFTISLTFSDEHLRLQAPQQADVLAEELIPAIVHLAFPGRREALAGRGAVQDVELAGLEAGDPQAFLHREVGDVALPDGHAGKVQPESFHRVLVPLDGQELAIAGHAVAERRAAAPRGERDDRRGVRISGLQVLPRASLEVGRVVVYFGKECPLLGQVMNWTSSAADSSYSFWLAVRDLQSQ